MLFHDLGDSRVFSLPHCPCTYRFPAEPDERSSLLRTASCVLYTPSREHFGIVPVEAMCSGAPVIAVNSGERPIHFFPGHTVDRLSVRRSSPSSPDIHSAISLDACSIAYIQHYHDLFSLLYPPLRGDKSAVSGDQPMSPPVHTSCFHIAD